MNLIRHVVGAMCCCAALPVQPAAAQKVGNTGGGVVTPMALPGCGVGIPELAYQGPPPPEKKKFASSPGGVDMRSGSFVYENSDLSIGGEGDAGLSLVRSFSFNLGTGDFAYQSMGKFFTHNWDIQLRVQRTPRAGACYPSQYNYNVSVVYGGLGEGFQSFYSPINFSQTAPAGYAELSASPSPDPTSYIFTARDGTVVTFLRLPRL